MEFLGSMFEIGKNLWERFGYMRGLDENMQNLKRKMEYLNSQMDDIYAEVSNVELRPEKRRKKEVEVWLRDVRLAGDDVRSVEQEVVRTQREVRNIFARARLGKHVLVKIQEVSELEEKGRIFNAPVIDENPTGRLVIPPTKDFVESTEARNTENVWGCLMNDDIRKIGVYGMGGVGKTTIMKNIHNRLLEERDKFDRVFWITVSESSNIVKLQNRIADALKLTGLNGDDETMRALELHAVLSLHKKSILILDDVWEVFHLENVGIPEPTRSNGCKVVLTTRSSDVCRMMDCNTVKVDLLTEEEALNLFLSKAVGHDTVLPPEVKEIAAKIAKECARLPLAIVTVAGSLRGLVGIREWRNALNELIILTKDVGDGERQIFERLKFSYSRLGDKVLQDCFLYCALYPEDHNIQVAELIEYWIAEELIAEMDSVESKFDKGHAIKEKLTRNCLLESCTDLYGEECVRMHDLIRDMALTITASSPRFMVKAGAGRVSVPYEDWSEDLERISLMDTVIEELPSRPPFCPRLTTLILKNSNLREIPDSFFANMHCLEVLDLSENHIESLPESISNLEKLHALNLGRLITWMSKLTRPVLSLEKLKALKEVKLTLTDIEEVPEGIEELVNLRRLDLSFSYKLQTFPGWKLRRLSKLQFLRLDNTSVKVSAKDLMCLRKLKVVGVQFHNVQELTTYVTSQQCQGLEKYSLIVGEIFGHLTHKIGKEVNINIESEPFGIGVDLLVLPGDICSIGLGGFHDIINLSAIRSLKDAGDLRCITVKKCDGLESIFSSTSFSEDGKISLRTIKSLRLIDLPSCRVLFDGIVPPHNISFNLKRLDLFYCPTLKYIFPVQLLQNFPSLEQLKVWRCENVEDIVVEESEMSDGANHGVDSNTITLPKLKELSLSYLPRLKSIYNGVMVSMCQSLTDITVFECPMVRRLPLSVHMDGEQATAPHALEWIRGNTEWLESLEWDDPHTKTILQPLFTKWGR